MPRSDERTDLTSVFSSPALTTALICVFLGAIDLTVIAAILPQMIDDLQINTSDIDRYIWIVSGYLIAYIVAIPIVGRISDLIGRKSTFLLSLGIFLIGSIVCGMATDLDGVIIGRSIQGFGGGGLLPVALALTGDVLPRRRRLAGIGIVSAADTLGWVIGPIYGAAVEAIAPGSTEHWRWVFWINIPLLVIAAILVIIKFPRETSTTTPALTALRRFDIPGAIILSGTLVALNLALSAGGEIGSSTGMDMRALGGTPNPLADQVGWLLGLAAIGIVAMFVVIRRSRYPILPRRLLANRSYALICLANLLVGAVLMVGMVDVPIVVSLLGNPGHTSEISAAMLATYTVGLMICTVVSPRVVRHWGSTITTIAGLILAAAGYAMLYPLLEGGHLYRMIPGLIAAGCGLGFLLAPLSALALDQASEEDRGSAASTALVFRLLGMTIGISALTSLAVQRLQTLTERLEPMTRNADETTASYLVRQQQFLETRVIPLSVQVIQETFLIAAMIAVICVVPIWMLRRSFEERSTTDADLTLP